MKKKKLFYFSFIRWPGEKAHAAYVTAHANSLSEQGWLVALVTPRRFGTLSVDPEKYFDQTITFRVIKLFCIDLLWLPVAKSVWHWLGVASFGISSCWLFLRQVKADDYVSTNDLFLAWLFSWWHQRVIYEIHDYPGDNHWLLASAQHRLHRIMSNTKVKAKRLIEQYELAPEKVFTVANGVDLKRFDLAITKETARQKLQINRAGPLVVYTGHLYDWKGATVLAEATKSLHDDIVVLFIGGTKADIVAFKKEYGAIKNIDILGHKPPAEIPLYLAAADILVLPNSGKSTRSVWQTSPMKLFEYMASQRLIIASDLPSIKEVLNPESAILVPSDDVGALAKAINDAVKAPNSEQVKVESAYRSVQAYTWSARAAQLVSNI